MKFVYNEEKEKNARNMLMMQPTIEEAEEALKKDETDPYAWYLKGTALALVNKPEEAIDAYSIGISYAPFYAPNYFGRGRRHNVVGEWRQAIADFTMCIALDSQNWTYWYYRATTENINGLYEDSVEDFKACLKISRKGDQYPIGDWIYTTLATMGKYKEAVASLKDIADDEKCEQMDYGYKRTVQLYKGIIKPEEFIDLDLFKEKMLPRPNRVELELTGMYYGMYWFYMINGEEEKANEAIKKILAIDLFPTAFGYQKALQIAKEKGITK
jgi:hypothetical protein